MRKSGLGLKNVRQRLEARYGNEASMHVTAENGKFRVELSFPSGVEEVMS
jgi:LytS/YehU family sensor histidine kinase